MVTPRLELFVGEQFELFEEEFLTKSLGGRFGEFGPLCGLLNLLNWRFVWRFGWSVREVLSWSFCVSFGVVGGFTIDFRGGFGGC